MDLLSIIAILFVLVCLGGIAGAIYLYRLDLKYANIPGPPNDSFIFGNYRSWKPYIEAEQPIDYAHDMFQKYGKTIKLRILNLVIIDTIDPDVIKELGSSGRHPKPYLMAQFFGILFGLRYMCDKSILTETSVEKSRWKRAQFNQMFHKTYFRDMSTDMNTSIEPLMARLSEVADGKTRVTMLDEFNHVTLDVLAKIAFGVDLNSVDSTTNPFTSAVFETFKGLADQSRNPFFRFHPKNWKQVSKAREAVKLLRNFGKKLIAERIAARANGEHTPDDVLSLIASMKENNPNMDDEELVDDFITFFVAGQETTASLLAYVIVCLGRHPDVMKRLQEEIDETVGDKPVIDYNDLQRLPYLDMVIKETLRLFPPVGGAAREAAFDIKSGDVTIPKGSMVVLVGYSCCRSEENFEDHMTFNPERFSPTAEKRINPYTYFPFSMGPRTCIGKYFADMESKIILTKLVQRFNFELDPNQSFEFRDVVTIRPKGGAVVTLTLRNHNQ